MNEAEWSEIADGLALWQEHAPQTPEDWLAVARRCLTTSPKPDRPSPLFGALLLAVEALIECATVSGADVSDGPPGWPEVHVWAVQEVEQLRKDHDE